LNNKISSIAIEFNGCVKKGFLTNPGIYARE